MSRRMIFVVAVSALSGLLVALMIGEEAPERHAVPAADAPPVDATDAMAKALRKAIEGER